jgi:starch-binding outer membrane protein, SusD/RagB family
LMRGIRWIDIKRLNKEGKNIIPKRLIDGQTYLLPLESSYYALPLPQDILNLTGMPQN